jgi:hypothetical protein
MQPQGQKYGRIYKSTLVQEFRSYKQPPSMETGAAMIGPLHPRDETATEKPTEDRHSEEEDPFADYDSEREEDKRMDDGGGSRGDSVEFAGNPAKEMCRHVISTEGESGSADRSVDTGSGTLQGTVQGCAPDPDPGRENSQQSSLDMTVDETVEGGGDGGVPAASSTPLRSAETFRIVTIEAQNDKRTDGSLAGFVAAAVDKCNKVTVRGDAHSAGGTDAAIHSGDGNAAKSGFVVSEKLAKAISAA